MDQPSDQNPDRRSAPRPELTEQAQKAKMAAVQREQEALKALTFRQERDKPLDLHAEKRRLLQERLTPELHPRGMEPARRKVDPEQQAEINVAARYQAERIKIQAQAKEERMKGEASQTLSHDQQDRRQLSEEHEGREERRGAAIAQAKARLRDGQDHKRNAGRDEALGPEEVTPEYIKAVEAGSPDKVAEKEPSRDASIASIKERFAKEASHELNNDRNK